MSQDTQYGLGAVEFGVATPVVLGGITRMRIATQTEIDNETATDAIYPEILSTTEQRPVAEFSTNAIAAALTQVGATGLDIDGLTNGLLLYEQLHVDGGGRASGSTHRELVVKDGIIVPRRLTCEHRGTAEISYEVITTWDGTNDPITITETAALPSGSVNTEKFSLGPVSLESIDFSSKIRLEVDFGIQLAVEGGDSDVWDTIVSIQSIKPVITLRGRDPTWFASAAVPLAGLAITHTNTAIYLRKRAHGGSFESGNEHIKITAAGMAIVEDVFDAQGNNTGETQIRVLCYNDGSNAPLVITTGQALP